MGDGDLILKASEVWPRTAKVYCHRADGEWPAFPEVVDEAGVRSCERRGVAIDPVLDRGRENRSQLVFTRLRNGREAIFWQTARTARSSRPGVRVPARRASSLRELTILVDSRERYAYRFDRQQATTGRRALPAGDYGVEMDGEIAAVVERKSIDDLAKGISDGGLAFQMAELSALPRAAVVVEDRYSRIFRHEYLDPGVFADRLAQLHVRYPGVPIVFCETRPLAEEWTFRFLGAALVAHRDQPISPTAPRELID